MRSYKLRRMLTVKSVQFLCLAGHLLAFFSQNLVDLVSGKWTIPDCMRYIFILSCPLLLDSSSNRWMSAICRLSKDFPLISHVLDADRNCCFLCKQETWLVSA